MRLLPLLRELLFPGFLGAATAVMGGIGLADQLFGGSNQGPSPGATAGRFYNPNYLPQTDTNFNNLNSNYSNQATGLQNTVDPYFGQSLGQQANINMNPLIQAGQMGGNASMVDARMLQLMGGQQAMAGNQIYQTAMDPQNAMFNRGQQQVTDQSNAVNSMYGLGSSPAGAANTAGALSNYDINWQNQQLQRQLQGVQGMTQANSAAGNFYGQAPAAYLQGGQMPIQAQITAAQNPASAAAFYSQNYQNAMQPESQAANQSLQYLNYGAGGQANAFNASLGAANYNAGQTQGAVNGLMNGLGQMGAPSNGSGMFNFFGGGGSGNQAFNNAYGGSPTSTFENAPT